MQPPKDILNNVITVLIQIAVVLIFANLSAIKAAAPAGYHLVWGDEFNDTQLDPNKWQWGSLPWGGQHHNDEYASYITPEDSYLSNGSLILRCRKGNFGGYPYSEGFVHSNGRFRYRYGYVEIRARFPTGRGVWPAFWSLSDGWPPEFDIAEYFGFDNRMHYGLAYGTCCPVNWDSSNYYEDAAGWHTYGLGWSEGFAIWYRDGAQKKAINASYVPSVSMYLILNSGMRWDADNSTPFPNYFEVDYIRVYSPGASTPPYISDIVNRTTPINKPAGPIPFIIGDAETSPDFLILTVNSSNPMLVPTTNIVLGGSGSNRTVTVTPASNQSGSATITINVFDGHFTAFDTFTLTVSGTNSSPYISSLPDRTIPVNGSTGVRQITVWDAETSPSNLVLTATSSDIELVTTQNVYLSGSGSTRYVLVKPALNKSGIAFITLQVSDGSLSSQTSFMLTVTNPANRLLNSSFEQGVSEWQTVFGGTVSSTTAQARQGRQAGVLTGRTQWYHGIGQSIAGRITNGVTYRCSVWVRLQGTTNDNVYITVRQNDDNGTSYTRVLNARASSSSWTRLAGDFTPSYVGTLNEMIIYVEGASSGVDIIVDDFELVPKDTDLLIARGSQWQYYDLGTYPTRNWFALNYNDSWWKTGPAQLGYGDGDEATTVDFGNATNRYITTLFRHTFYLDNPWKWTALELSLLRDDGAVVYINGSEVFRSNMPEGLIYANTLATATVSGEEESTRYIRANLPAGLLVQGSNVVAVEVHQVTNTSSDLSFDLELRGISSAPEIILPQGYTWKYNDSGVDLGSLWRSPSYDDSGWNSGFAQLGYGDGDETTLISYGGDAKNKYITTYFRTTFNVDDVERYGQWIARLLIDDGAVVYLNGVEVFRSNMPESIINFSTRALQAAPDDGTVWFATNIPPAIIVNGLNTVAVEVHQNSPSSSDLSFDFELIAIRKDSLPQIIPAFDGQSLVLRWQAFAAGYIIECIDSLSAVSMQWQPLSLSPVLTNGFYQVTLPLNQPQTRFYRLKQQIQF